MFEPTIGQRARMLKVPVALPDDIKSAFQVNDFAGLFDRVSRIRQANGYHALVEGDVPTGVHQAERLLHLAKGMLAWPALGIGSIEAGAAPCRSEDAPRLPNPGPTSGTLGSSFVDNLR